MTTEGKITTMIREKINKLEISIAELSQRIKVIEKRLFGNGVKGILIKIDEIIEYMTMCKERDKLKEGIESWNRKKFLWYGSAVFIIVQIVLEVIKMKIQSSGG